MYRYTSISRHALRMKKTTAYMVSHFINERIKGENKAYNKLGSMAMHAHPGSHVPLGAFLNFV